MGGKEHVLNLPGQLSQQADEQESEGITTGHRTRGSIQSCPMHVRPLGWGREAGSLLTAGIKEKAAIYRMPAACVKPDCVCALSRFHVLVA